MVVPGERDLQRTGRPSFARIGPQMLAAILSSPATWPAADCGEQELGTAICAR